MNSNLPIPSLTLEDLLEISTTSTCDINLSTIDTLSISSIDLSSLNATGPSYNYGSSIFGGSGGSGLTSGTGGGGGAGAYSGGNYGIGNISFHNPLPSGLKVSGDAEFEGEIKIKGRSLGKILEGIEKRLSILVPDKEKLEHFESLRKAYEHYKTIEALCEVPKNDEEN